MKNYILSLIVLAAIFTTSLPLSVNGQTRRQNQSGVGTSDYYNDDSVIFRSNKVFVSSVDLIVGASPEIAGGLKTSPASDEEDVALDKRIIVATKTSRNNIYIGWLNPTVNGKQVIVRRKKASKKIIAIVNCGNWTRELGADYSFECNPIPGACVPGETKSDTQENVSDDGLTVTVIKTTTDGCKTTIEKVITKTVKETKNVCVEGAWVDVLEQGDSAGKLGDKFKVADAISGLPEEVKTQILSGINKKEINYLLVQQGACENEKGKIKVRWFVKGGKWNWFSFLVGAGVGFLGGYLIKRTRNNPVPAKIQNQTLPPRTGISGSGSTSGGSVGTRRTRPR